MAISANVSRSDVPPGQHHGGTTGASRVLTTARDAGLITTVDCVSVAHPDFRLIALASLREADVLFINEFEAGQVLEREIGRGPESLRTAASDLARLGGRARVVLHSPEGAVSATPHGEVCSQGSVALPDSLIAGATGAGDAFAAGYLDAMHHNLPEEQRLRLAACAGATSLTDPTPSGGMQPAAQCLALGEQHGYRPF